MKKFIYLLAVVMLSGCNVFEPFDTKSTTNDLMELATQCLDNGDFGCAINYYNQLPAGLQRDQNLCVVYLAKAGMTIDTLINIINAGSNSNSQMVLGQVAQAMMPWSSTQSSDIQSAVTSCNNFSTDTSADTTAALLVAISYFTDCAVRIARTDQFVGGTPTADGGNASNNDDHDTVCMTPGLQAGKVTAEGVGYDGLSPLQTGMCQTDVVQCQSDIQNVLTNSDLKNALNNNGLSYIVTAFENVPPSVQNTGIALDTARYGISQTVPAN